MNSSEETFPLKIVRRSVLVTGYINLNVIDGSSFFLTGLSSMLGLEPGLDVKLISANKIKQTEVIEELSNYRNVEVIDPFEALSNSKGMSIISSAADTLTREEYANVIGEYVREYKIDRVITRDTALGALLSDELKDLDVPLFVYVTGLTGFSKDETSSVRRDLERCHSRGARFFVQTDAIEQKLTDLLPTLNQADVFVLPPHVPDSPGEFKSIYHHSTSPSVLNYSSKFFKQWNADRILAGFKEVNSRRGAPNIALHVAGDQFRRAPEDPYFVENVKYLLTSTPGVTWHGRLPRRESRRLIRQSHLGISWRSEDMNGSTELSTKIIENGALGRATIVNRNPQHEDLLGRDYPFFANSMSDYKEILLNLPKSERTLKEASETCFSLAQRFTYSSVLPAFLRFIFPGPIVPEEATAVLLAEAVHTENATKYQGWSGELDGAWLSLFKDPSSPEVGSALSTAIALKEGWVQQLQFFDNFMKDRSSAEIQCGRSPNHHTSPNREPAPSVGTLLRRIEDLELQLTKSERSLAALRGSKLGRLQVHYWQFKKR